MRTSMLAVLTGSILALTGCGETKVPITGSVTKGGKPFVPPEGGMFNVSMTQDGGTASGTGAVGADGNFTIKGPADGGMPAGKYKVSIVAYPDPKNVPKDKQPMPKTITGGETWDVSGSNNKFTIDLDKYK